ncbi:MAG: 50S ribosomal protein L21 [Patescibacteria group bacterium]|nr:50S ribosomal protein L21 [Patescibacteria group bacterium]
MIAIIKTGGKQYKIKPGSVLKVEKLDVEAGKTIEIKEVLLIADENGADIKIGDPLVKGASVEAKVLEQGRADKIRVIKYKPKIRYRKEFGHRQPYTKLEIVSIK